MKSIAVALLLCCAIFPAQAAHRHKAPHDGSVTHNRDSKDPSVGWHNDPYGGRVCTSDCDNTEIPGSGYTCKDVTVMGMAMRECDR